MALRWLLHSACTQILGTQIRVNSGRDLHKQVFHWVSNASPLHPRYKKADYETMEEWKVDMVLREYGLSFKGTLDEKREFAIGAFLWPDQI
ncbi:hypothetical protein HHK36_002253 [Tetracentron sinense]|uniref:DUF7722 domain-containing protein n=1 Tax=Tetracentron sinense TaxID=13715 RepID=A0A835DRT4_TETSI|nr:hypothetical protein HHK36_002253 [Tetracentron sinense]